MLEYRGEDLIYTEATPGHPHYHRCTPDYNYQRLSDLEVSQVVRDGVRHVVLDCDGTVWPDNGRSRWQLIPEQHKRKIAEVVGNPVVRSVSVATECGQHDDVILEDLGLPAGSVVIKPWAVNNLYFDKTTLNFWRKLLFLIDAYDEPERVLMVGNSMLRDVATPAQLGIRTALLHTMQHQETSIRGELWSY